MTGQGTRDTARAPSEQEIIDSVKLMSVEDFVNSIARYNPVQEIKSTFNQREREKEINELYGSYKHIMHLAGVQSFQVAEEIDAGTKKNLALLEIQEIKKFFKILYDILSESGNIFGTLVISREYQKVRALPDEIRSNAIFIISQIISDSSDAESIMQQLALENSCFQNPSLKIFVNVFSEHRSWNKRKLSFEEYVQVHDSIKGMLERGEESETIEKLYRAIYSSKFSQNKDFAAAHFYDHLNLKTHASVDELNKARCGFILEDISQELSFLARAMTGFPLEVKQADYKSPPHFDGLRIILPSSVPLKTKEQAKEFYLVSAVHQAGQVEFGTFDIDLEKLVQTKNQLEAYNARKSEQ